MEANKSGLAIKVAIGVFMGLCAFGLVTCAGLVYLGGIAQEKEEQDFQRGLQMLRDVSNDPDPLGIQQHANERRAQERMQREMQARRQEDALRPGPGERCINGQRFQRVENGWVQTSSACR